MFQSLLLGTTVILLFVFPGLCLQEGFSLDMNDIQDKVST